MNIGQMVTSGEHNSRSMSFPDTDFCEGILNATLNRTEQEDSNPEQAHSLNLKINGLDSDSHRRPKWQSDPGLQAADLANPSPCPLQSKLTSSSWESPVHSVRRKGEPRNDTQGRNWVIYLFFF